MRTHFSKFTRRLLAALSGRSRIGGTIVVLLLGAMLSGCQVFEAGKKMARHTTRMLTPNPNDHQDSIDRQGAGDEWRIHGVEARGEQPTEEEGPLFFGSEKARSINRNFGFEPFSG